MPALPREITNHNAKSRMDYTSTMRFFVCSDFAEQRRSRRRRIACNIGRIVERPTLQANQRRVMFGESFKKGWWISFLAPLGFVTGLAVLGVVGGIIGAGTGVLGAHYLRKTARYKVN